MEENEHPTEASAGPPTAAPGPDTGGPSAGSTGDQLLNQLRGLRRSTDDKVVAGVLGGVGRSLGIDPLLLRVVLAVLVLFGGTGIVLYALGWLLMPQDDGTASVGQQVVDRSRFRPSASTVWLAALLVVAISIGAFGAFALWHRPVLLPVVVVAILLLLLRRPDQPRVGAPAPDAAAAGAGSTAAGSTVAVPTPAVPATAGPTQQPYPTQSLYAPQPQYAPQSQYPPQPPQPPTWTAPVPPQPPRPPKPRSHLFGTTFSLALIALGLLGVADLYGADVPAGAYPALALAIAGIGLLVGTWFGRARGLIFWGIVLVPVLMVATIAGHARSISHRTINETVTITVPSQLPTADRYGAGHVEYDLTGLDLTGRTADLNSQMGFGEIVVTVPRTMDVRVDARIGVGGLSMFGAETGGVDQREIRTDNGPDGVGGGHLDIKLYAGFGHLEVRRETS